MRKKIAALTVAVLLAGGSLAAASSASADMNPPGGGSWDYIWYTTDADSGGTIYIEEHGDIVELCDSAADGYAARASVTDGTAAGTYYLTAAEGSGTCVTSSASMGGAHDLPEGQKITVTIWVGTGDRGKVSHSFMNDH